MKKLIALMLAQTALSVMAVTSPDGSISVTHNTANNLEISVLNDNGVQLLATIKMPVNSVIANDDMIRQVDYEMITGKRKHCTNSYREICYRLDDGDSLTVRVYNDGVAWKSSGISTVDLSRARHKWLQKWTDSYEGFFPRDVDVSAGSRWGYPALMEFDNGIYALLTESGIERNNAATSMWGTDSTGVFDLRPDGPESGGWQTLIAGTLPEVVESTLVTDNSAPCRLNDTSWVEPGVAAWIYWAYNHGSNDYEIIKKYVDLAVELSLPYMLIDAEWDEMGNGKTVEDAVAYAVEQHIKPLIWYNSSVGWVNGAPGPKFRLNDPADREREMAWCDSLGIKGLKIDFFSGDTNLNISYMIDLIETAARHNLLVNFHGATLPRGWQRTYPNLVTTEGVYGAEWYNNVPTFTSRAAAHNAMLPFTRNIVGSMDYTPCAFSDSQHPHITTHGHELALTVLFESGIQHLADRPESLLAQPSEVKDFFGKLPTAWDDTVLLDGYPGEFVVMARRKGDRWYIAGINGTDTPISDLRLDLSRLNLPNSPASITLMTDSSATDADPWQISAPASLPGTISILPRGGFVMVVEM